MRSAVHDFAWDHHRDGFRLRVRRNMFLRNVLEWCILQINIGSVRSPWHPSKHEKRRVHPYVQNNVPKTPCLRIEGAPVDTSSPICSQHSMNMVDHWRSRDTRSLPLTPQLATHARLSLRHCSGLGMWCPHVVPRESALQRTCMTTTVLFGCFAFAMNFADGEGEVIQQDPHWVVGSSNFVRHRHTDACMNSCGHTSAR